MGITNFIKHNFFAAMLSLIMVLLVASVAITVYNRHVMLATTELKTQTQLVKDEFALIFNSTLRQIDMGLRGYALTRNEGLLSPFNNALRDNERNMRTIDSLLRVQNLEQELKEFSKIRQQIYAYIDHSKIMRQAAEQGDLEEFVRLLNMDKGLDLWNLFAPLNTRITQYEDNLIAEAEANYAMAMNRNVIFQIILLLIGLPTLFLIIVRIRKEAKERNELLTNFEQNNWLYLFNPGEQRTGSIDARNIINNSIGNLKQASNFIKSITQGDFAVQWQGMNNENRKLNEENLAGHLIRMRDEMKRVKLEDEQRLWATEGLAQFSEIVRNNQHSQAALCDSVVRYLTQYVKAQQGSLFIVQDDTDANESYLSLSACFAFDKKKYVEKRIELGSGLVGQACMEGSTLYLKEIPQGYTQITSGLGESTPTCLVIVPMKYNERVECAFELASFSQFEPYQLSFLEKAGEFVASALFSVKSTEHTANLLRAAQENTEMLRSQEEEMRQNMEELQATQEEMARKESESSKALQECREENEKLRRNLVSSGN